MALCGAEGRSSQTFVQGTSLATNEQFYAENKEESWHKGKGF